VKQSHKRAQDRVLVEVRGISKKMICKEPLRMEDDVGFMVRIRVVSREIELLNLSYKTMNIPKNYILENGFIFIDQNELENLDIMINCVLDTFLKIGLLANDEPNKLGFELEEFNEKIIHEYVKLNK